MVLALRERKQIIPLLSVRVRCRTDVRVAAMWSHYVYVRIFSETLYIERVSTSINQSNHCLHLVDVPVVRDVSNSINGTVHIRLSYMSDLMA